MAEILRKTFRFRLEPNAAQTQAMEKSSLARRWVWNWALARRLAYFKKHGRGISSGQLSRELTCKKHGPGFEWLNEVNSQLLQQSLADLDAAFRSYFSGLTRFPRFRSKKSDSERFRVPQAVRVVGKEVSVPKIGRIKFRKSRPINGVTKSATFKRDVCGKWYVAIVVESQKPQAGDIKDSAEPSVGIDLGLKDFLVSSSGERIEHPKFNRRIEARLRLAHRLMRRKRRGSRRWERAKVRAGKLSLKASNQRRDFLHKISDSLVRRYQTICIEDLCPKMLAKTKLAKSTMDTGLGEFRHQLKYKAEWAGRYLVIIDRFYPSTKTCNECGSVAEGLTLSDRVWTCRCGIKHDRDFNASKNIRDEGLRTLVVGHTERKNARGVCVRPSTRRLRAVKREPVL
jgi:putative transposase